MSWFTHTAGTFRNSVRDNSQDQLDTELKSLETTLAVLKTGYVDLGLGESSASGAYTEAAKSMWQGGETAGQISSMNYRAFVGIKSASNIDCASWNIWIPSDAVASTSATVRFHCRYSLATTTKAIKVYFAWDKWAIDDAMAASNPHTPAYTSDQTLSVTTSNDQEYVVIDLTLTNCSAGEFVHLIVYRNADDAADTFTGQLNIAGATLLYTRTA